MRKESGQVTFKPTSMRRVDIPESAANPPPAKQQTLMADATKTATSSRPKKVATTKPKGKTIRNISTTEKNKAPVPGAHHDDEPSVPRKLRPILPKHNDTHPNGENMKERKDKGPRKWRELDQYAMRRRTFVDYRFQTKEQQDFYETVLLDRKPIVSDMRWVDWEFIDDNEDHFPRVHETYKDDRH